MTAVDDARARLKTRKKPKAAPPWRRPEPADFLAGQRVLAFDATLTNCGWAAIEVTDRVIVRAKGTIRPVTDQAGYLGTWDKARMLQACLGEVISCSGPEVQFVVEAPSVGGGSRTESSLIAGMFVWLADPSGPGACSVVSATHVSSVLLGDPRVRSAERKRRIREEVIRLVPGAAGRDYNEHVRDAIATGLTELYDLKRGQR